MPKYKLLLIFEIFEEINFIEIQILIERIAYNSLNHFPLLFLKKRFRFRKYCADDKTVLIGNPQIGALWLNNFAASHTSQISCPFSDIATNHTVSADQSLWRELIEMFILIIMKSIWLWTIWNKKCKIEWKLYTLMSIIWLVLHFCWAKKKKTVYSKCMVQIDFVLNFNVKPNKKKCKYVCYIWCHIRT